MGVSIGTFGSGYSSPSEERRRRKAPWLRVFFWRFREGRAERIFVRVCVCLYVCVCRYVGVLTYPVWVCSHTLHKSDAPPNTQRLMFVKVVEPLWSEDVPGTPPARKRQSFSSISSAWVIGTCTAPLTGSIFEASRGVTSKVYYRTEHWALSLLSNISRGSAAVLLDMP